jgi:hypothetical protein
MLYLALFVVMAATASVAFKLWSITEARRRSARRAVMQEPVLTEGAPTRPSVRHRPF